jgi:hypothetical protein
LLVDEFLVFGVLSFPDSDFALWAGRKFWCTWEIFFAGERGVFFLSSDTAKVRQFSENVKIFRQNFWEETFLKVPTFRNPEIQNSESKGKVLSVFF